ncbi:MAG: hypothetical protein UX89_C0002G0065 [Parcubacteria group bacterium GW2011_GWA2_47_16]|nr:MAG: hypothetical protein UX89_C0002G0065 [Parcubacteria group bacterium GW2011_GWA2_47_16]
MATMLKNEIRLLARNSVHEAVTAEMMRIRASLLPVISKKEQKNIEKLYKKPSKYFVRTLRTSFCGIEREIQLPRFLC